MFRMCNTFISQLSRFPYSINTIIAIQAHIFWTHLVVVHIFPDRRCLIARINGDLVWFYRPNNCAKADNLCKTCYGHLNKHRLWNIKLRFNYKTICIHVIWKLVCGISIRILGKVVKCFGKNVQKFDVDQATPILRKSIAFKTSHRLWENFQ